MTKISQLAYRNNYLIPELINQYYWPQHSNLIHYKAFCPNNILYLWWEHTYPRNFESLHLCFYCSKTIQFFFYYKRKTCNILFLFRNKYSRQQWTIYQKRRCCKWVYRVAENVTSWKNATYFKTKKNAYLNNFW